MSRLFKYFWCKKMFQELACPIIQSFILNIKESSTLNIWEPSIASCEIEDIYTFYALKRKNELAKLEIDITDDGDFAPIRRAKIRTRGVFSRSPNKRLLQLCDLLDHLDSIISWNNLWPPLLWVSPDTVIDEINRVVNELKYE